MGTLIQHGTVINASSTLQADVLLEGETIAAVGPNLPPAGPHPRRSPPASLLQSGGIDVHTLARHALRAPPPPTTTSPKPAPPPSEAPPRHRLRPAVPRPHPRPKPSPHGTPRPPARPASTTPSTWPSPTSAHMTRPSPKWTTMIARRHPQLQALHGLPPASS